MGRVRPAALHVVDGNAGNISTLRAGRREISVIAADFDGTIVEDHVDYKTDKRALELAKLIASRDGQFEFTTVTGSRISRTQGWADLTLSTLFAENAGVSYDPRKDPSDRINIRTSEEKAKFITDVVAPEIEVFLAGKYPGFTKSDGKYTMATYHIPDNVKVENFYADIVGFVNQRFNGKSQDLFITYSHTLVDVNFKGATKARAVPILRSSFGVKGSNITIIGDGHNDIPAFDAALEVGGKVVIPANARIPVPANEPIIDWLSKNKNNPSIWEHDLRSTECVYDVVSGLRRIAA